MSYEIQMPPKNTNKTGINWINECIIGAFLSVAFTLMAMNSGSAGVTEGSLAADLHQVMIVGGVGMVIVCSIAAALLLVGQIMSGAAHITKKSFAPGGLAQAAKFVKIFLP